MFVFDSRSRLAKDIPLQSKENSHNNEMGDWNNFQLILLESAKAKKVVYKKRSFGTWSQYKQVYQSRQQIIRAYCPNIYCYHQAVRDENKSYLLFHYTPSLITHIYNLTSIKFDPCNQWKQSLYHQKDNFSHNCLYEYGKFAKVRIKIQQSSI